MTGLTVYHGKNKPLYGNIMIMSDMYFTETVVHR